MTITIPPAPDPIGFSGNSPVSISYSFASTGNGGSKILEWQVGYGTHPTAVQKTVKSGGVSLIKGLRPATTYYFWARGRNSKGWGPWSVRMSRRTAAGARAKIGTSWKEAIPMVRVKGKWQAAEVWIRSGGKWHRSI